MTISKLVDGLKKNPKEFLNVLNLVISFNFILVALKFLKVI